MITDILHAIGAFFVVAGAVFCMIGGLGVVRLPDFYSRCHGAGVTDSAGAGALLLGLMFLAPPLVAFKLLALLAFLWVSSAVSTHALAKAAYSRGVRIVDVPRKDWTIPPPAPEDMERLTSALGEPAQRNEAAEQNEAAESAEPNERAAASEETT